MKYYKFYGDTLQTSYHTPPVGKPIQISFWAYFFMSCSNYLLIKVPDGTPLNEVVLLACEKMGAHRNSYYANESLKENGLSREKE